MVIDGIQAAIGTARTFTPPDSRLSGVLSAADQAVTGFKTISTAIKNPGQAFTDFTKHQLANGLMPGVGSMVIA